MPPSSPPEIPLLHNGDAYYIKVSEPENSQVRILYVTRYEDNTNTIGTGHRFSDLDSETQVAVRVQVARRFNGCVVLT